MSPFNKLESDNTSSDNTDLLERKIFSQKLAQGLSQWGEKDESIIAALTGNWGSGKSFIVDMAKDELLKNKCTLFEFNPALYTEKGCIQDYFFTELTKTLRTDDNSEKFEGFVTKLKLYKIILDGIPNVSEIREKIKNISYLISISFLTLPTVIQDPLKKILNLDTATLKPYCGILGLIILAIPTTQTILNYLIRKFSKEKTETTITDIKKQIQTELQTTNKKLIIIIDDIDRLTKTEIRELLLMIKINADFSNTNYLLLYDEDIVNKYLHSDEEIKDKNFLEKIIQVNIPIPEIEPERIEILAYEYIAKIFSDIKNKFTNYKLDEEYLLISKKFGIHKLFKNIREIKRFCNRLKISIAMYINDDIFECDPIDIMCIELVRFFEPNLLTKIYTDENHNYDEMSFSEFIFNNSTSLNNRILIKIIRLMFSERNKKRNEISIAHPQNFHKYFSLCTIQSITESEKHSLLNSLSTDYFRTQFLNLKSKYTLSTVLNTILKSSQKIKNKDKFNFIIDCALQELSASKGDEKKSISMFITFLGTSSLMNEECFNNIIKNTSDAFTPLKIIDDLKERSPFYSEQAKILFSDFFTGSRPATEAEERFILDRCYKWKIELDSSNYVAQQTNDYKKLAKFIKKLSAEEGNEEYIPRNKLNHFFKDNGLSTLIEHYLAGKFEKNDKGYKRFLEEFLINIKSESKNIYIPDLYDLTF